MFCFVVVSGKIFYRVLGLSWLFIVCFGFV